MAPEFKNVHPLIERVFNMETSRIAGLARESVRSVCDYLDLKIDFVESSAIFGNSGLKREMRIIDIVKQTGFSELVVPLGGKELYEKDLFKSHGIDLYYIKPIIEEYRQSGPEFLPSLSIIDVLMSNSKEKCRRMVQTNEFL